MTKACFISILDEMAHYQSEIANLDKMYDLFCVGSFDRPQILMSPLRWNEILETMQPVVVHYNPNFSDKSVEAYFYVKLSGKVYKIFALLAKEDK